MLLIDGIHRKFNRSLDEEPDDLADLRITLATMMMDVINEEEISGRWYLHHQKCRSTSGKH